MEDLFVQESSISTGKTPKESSVSSRPKAKEEMDTVRPEEKIVYSHEEAVWASIAYFRGDALAARVWANKYALKDSFGNLFEKTPDDMHRRLAREIRRIELK